MQKGGPAGNLHKPEEAPQAKFHGAICSHDSHADNLRIVKHLRAQLPDECVMLPSFCNPHHVGRAASDVTTRLNLLSRVWTLSKTFADGYVHVQLQRRVSNLLGNEEDGLEVVDPTTFVLQFGDLGEEITLSLLARCHEDNDAVVATASGQRGGDTHVFAAFFPYGWNRRRPLHLCLAGCGGPRSCHDRGVSVGKAFELVRNDILRRVVQVAKNKWAQMDPAFRQASLVVIFFTHAVGARGQGGHAIR